MKKKNQSHNEGNILQQNEAATVAASPSHQVPGEAYSLIPLSSIFPDPKQPRKYFNEAGMQELTASIKEKGVMQPVTVRPYPATLPLPENAAAPLYLLVVGERRLRGARAAGLAEIPAMIRTLSDDEALEWQIIENLQRADVKAMEEAVAFLALREKFVIEEIAVRVGKNGQYVANRLKLNDLIAEFQKMLAAEKMPLTDALKICRFPADGQKEIYKNCGIPKDWEKRKDWRLSNTSYYIDSQEHDLDKAQFKTNDATLYPEAGACNVCPHNSASNKLLFAELNKKRICHNGLCFKIKCTKSYQRKIQEAMQDPEILFVDNSYYLDNEAKALRKAAEEIGATILEREMFSKVYPHDLPQPWEEYLADNDTWSDDEEMSDEERQEALEECKVEWENDNKDYEKELKSYNELKQSGRIRRAFIVAGNDAGTIIDITLSPKKGVSISAGGNGNEQLANELELARLQERENRNMELDREKVYKKVIPEIKACEAYSSNTEPLQRREWEALILLLTEKGASYDTKKWLEGQLGTGRDHYGVELFKKLQGQEGEGLFYSYIRRVLLDGLISLTEADREKFGKAAAIYELSVLYLPENVAAFEKEQGEKAEKRKANVQKRIEAAQGKIQSSKKEVQEEALPEEEDERA